MMAARSPFVVTLMIVLVTRTRALYIREEQGYQDWAGYSEGFTQTWRFQVVTWDARGQPGALSFVRITTLVGRDVELHITLTGLPDDDIHVYRIPETRRLSTNIGLDLGQVGDDPGSNVTLRAQGSYNVTLVPTTACFITSTGDLTGTIVTQEDECFPVVLHAIAGNINTAVGNAVTAVDGVRGLFAETMLQYNEGWDFDLYVPDLPVMFTGYTIKLLPYEKDQKFRVYGLGQGNSVRPMRFDGSKPHLVAVSGTKGLAIRSPAPMYAMMFTWSGNASSNVYPSMLPVFDYHRGHEYYIFEIDVPRKGYPYHRYSCIVLEEVNVDTLYVYDTTRNEYIKFESNLGNSVTIEGTKYSWLLIGPFPSVGDSLSHSFSAWTAKRGFVPFAMWDFVVRTSSSLPFSAASAEFQFYNHRYDPVSFPVQETCPYYIPPSPRPWPPSTKGHTEISSTSESGINSTGTITTSPPDAPSTGQSSKTQAAPATTQLPLTTAPTPSAPLTPGEGPNVGGEETTVSSEEGQGDEGSSTRRAETTLDPGGFSATTTGSSQNTEDFRSTTNHGGNLGGGEQGSATTNSDRSGNTQTTATPPDHSNIPDCPCVYLSGVSLSDSSLSSLDGLYIRELRPALSPSVWDRSHSGQVYTSHDGRTSLYNRPIHRQLWSNGACPQYMFYHSKETEHWIVGPTPGINRGWLLNPQYYQSPGMLGNLWQVYITGSALWKSASSIHTSCSCEGLHCTSLTLVGTSGPYLSGSFVIFGVYNSRPVYKNTNSRLYIYYFMGDDRLCSNDEYWAVGQSVGLPGGIAYARDVAHDPSAINATWWLSYKGTWYKADSNVRISCNT